MKCDQIEIRGKCIQVYRFNHLVVGSGCAGFNVADWLYELGETDVAIVTEGVDKGTSRNTGSDKQTYYKLSLASDGSDSIREMAQTLFEGGGMDGDIALVQAACSVRSFMKLVNKGVHFPTNRYGEYVGYKTDHDPRQRATSAGPLTSKYMTEALQQSVMAKGINLFDGYQVIKLLADSGQIYGVLALDLKTSEENRIAYVLFECQHVILATGGPANIYDTSVYPESQTGATGLAIEIGAELANMQEWQYGLASTKFRWNVSGTYQQVLPKYIAVDAKGNSREFLGEYFESPLDALNQIFLKGYQWPFDVRKIEGSSIIDIIVHHEIFVKGNKVYMDFREDPTGLENGFENLGEKPYHYLKRSNALIRIPIKRLEKMNPQAIQLYKSQGIDLYKEPLEVAICAQHHNGGIKVDSNWESSIKGLYVIGEAAGTFGIYRPGGTALNATQVGGLRAAEHIAYDKKSRMKKWHRLPEGVDKGIKDLLEDIEKVLSSRTAVSKLAQQTLYYQQQMSRCAAHIRQAELIPSIYQEIKKDYSEWPRIFSCQEQKELAKLLKSREMLITQMAVLSAMITCMEETGSRGAALVLDEKGQSMPESLSEYRYKAIDQTHKDQILVTVLEHEIFSSYFQKVKPLPNHEDWFETTWQSYNKRIGI